VPSPAGARMVFAHRFHDDRTGAIWGEFLPFRPPWPVTTVLGKGVGDVGMVLAWMNGPSKRNLYRAKG